MFQFRASPIQRSCKRKIQPNFALLRLIFRTDAYFIFLRKSRYQWDIARRTSEFFLRKSRYHWYTARRRREFFLPKSRYHWDIARRGRDFFSLREQGVARSTATITDAVQRFFLTFGDNLLKYLKKLEM